MKRSKLILSLLVIFVLLFPLIASTSVRALAVTSENLQMAASYLHSMYTPSLGLVANSEDEGLNPLPLGEGVPCNNTYWVYDDNLWAGWALQPFYPSIAENITETVQQYSEKFGRSMLFEAAIGEPIPTTIHANKDVKVFDEVVNGSRVQVLLDRHQFADNSGLFDDAEEYADLCFYMAINYWMMGDTNASMHWFRTGEGMWNYTTNKGFYDKAAKSDNRYQNFKLGLFLLAQRVTGFQSEVVEEVEATAWSYQNDLGGITTQCWLDGSFYGTANAETTAALLLAYNSHLTNRLNKRQSYAEYMRELTEAQLDEALQTIDELTIENSMLKQDNVNLSNYPWLAENVPSWFMILLVSTFSFAITSCILVLRMKNFRFKPKNNLAS